MFFSPPYFFSNGSFFASIAVEDLSFYNKFTSKYKKRPIPGAIAIYDILSIFAEAVTNSNKEKDVVNNYIHNIKDFKGKIGKYSALTNNTFDVPASIQWVKDGNIIH